MYDFSSAIECWDPPLAVSPGHDNYYGIFTIKKGGQISAFVGSLYRNIRGDWNKTTKYHGLTLQEYYVNVHPFLDNVTYETTKKKKKSINTK